MSHTIRNTTALLVLAAASLGSHANVIDINGDVTQAATLRNSPVTSLAIGPNSTADAAVNTVRGGVKVNGSLKQTADLGNSPVTTLAIGPGAKSTAGVNAIDSR